MNNVTATADFEALFCGRPSTPESKLAVAVLLRAFDDATTDQPNETFITLADRAEARAFLLGLCEGLNHWCWAAGVPRDLVIDTARRLQRAGWQRVWRQHAAN